VTRTSTEILYFSGSMQHFELMKMPSYRTWQNINTSPFSTVWSITGHMGAGAQM